MNYEVTIFESAKYKVRVSAESAEEAELLALNKYYDGLDAASVEVVDINVEFEYVDCP